MFAAVSKKKSAWKVFKMAERLTSDSYKQVLIQKVFGELYEDGMIFSQDGAAVHTSRSNLKYINRKTHGQFISVKGKAYGSCCVDWPPRSPDLNVMDFFAWDLLKREFFKIPVPENYEQSVAKINDIFTNFNQNMGQFENAIMGIKRRAKACINENGGRFEFLD